MLKLSALVAVALFTLAACGGAPKMPEAPAVPAAPIPQSDAFLSGAGRMTSGLCVGSTLSAAWRATD